MQRFILLTCLTAFVVTSPAFAQQMEDVVHLKNGGLVRGTIIEQSSRRIAEDKDTRRECVRLCDG